MRNLVKGKDGKCNFERQPEFSLDALVPSIGPALPEKWSERVLFKAGEIHPRVLVQLDARYEFRQILEKAQLERDPELAPHVRFRKLSPGNDAVALGFIRECGPLFQDDMGRKPLVWINLNDFWSKHARFVAIARLYESIGDFGSLRDAFVNIVENIKSLDAAGPAELGKIPHTHKGLPYIRYVVLCESRDYRMVDEDGDPLFDHRTLQKRARQLICAELILQTFEGIRSGWEDVDEEGGMKFRPTRIVTSLWAAMWEMFGLDTWGGYGWRSCKICGKYFYPVQLNSECCNSAHQALWSKRQYAKKSRHKKRTEGG
jgi:hypothetical protein